MKKGVAGTSPIGNPVPGSNRFNLYRMLTMSFDRLNKSGVAGLIRCY